MDGLWAGKSILQTHGKGAYELPEVFDAVVVGACRQADQ
jgi:hypothetical protein